MVGAFLAILSTLLMIKSAQCTLAEATLRPLVARRYLLLICKRIPIVWCHTRCLASFSLFVALMTIRHPTMCFYFPLFGDFACASQIQQASAYPEFSYPQYATMLGIQ